MKFYLPLLLALSAIGPALGDEATCKQDSELVNQHQGQKYTEEIVGPLFPSRCFVAPVQMLTIGFLQASQTQSDTVRVLHPGDATTMDLRPGRYAMHLSPW